jgi:3'(2'), 5'-bisphosphate nucleotidase
MTELSDHAAAAELAEVAGAVLLEVRASGVSGHELKRLGDQTSNDLLLRELKSRFPLDGILSEESVDDGTRLLHERVWIIDPLDGTREFSEPPRQDWAVHVALVVNGTPVAGAVALPALGLTLSTPTPPCPAVLARAPRILVSRTRPSAHAQHLAATLGGELVPMGSAGAKAMAVVRGEADIYVHSGGQYEWDSAAPVAVAAAAGLHVSRLDGSALVYNQANPWLPDLLICRSNWVEAVLSLNLSSD